MLDIFLWCCLLGLLQAFTPVPQNGTWTALLQKCQLRPKKKKKKLSDWSINCIKRLLILQKAVSRMPFQSSSYGSSVDLKKDRVFITGLSRMISEDIIINSLQTIHTMDKADPVEISSPFSIISPWKITLYMITLAAPSLLSLQFKNTLLWSAWAPQLSAVQGRGS